MARLPEYVIPSKDVKIFCSIVGMNQPVAIETMASLSRVYSRSVQDIFAIGQEDPVDVIATNSSYTADIELQAGEYNSLLDLFNEVAISGGLTGGYASLLQIPLFTLTYVYNMTRAVPMRSASTSLLNCMFDNDSASIERNDPETLVSASMRGTGIIRSVSPLTVA